MRNHWLKWIVAFILLVLIWGGSDAAFCRTDLNVRHDDRVLFVSSRRHSPHLLTGNKILPSKDVQRKPSRRLSLSSSESLPSKRTYNWTKPTLSIAIPAVIGMLADPLLSLMDTAYVGRLGSLELAALGSCTGIFHLAFNSFRATTAATTSLVGTSLQQSKDDVRSVTSISLGLGIGIGILLLGVLLGFGNFGLNVMGVSRQFSPQYPAAASYLFTRAFSAPAVLFIVVAEGVFRGYGNTTIPLLASLIAALINLVLDPVLMFKPIGWGVAGAAAATAIAQFGAAFFYLSSLLRRKMLPQQKKAPVQPIASSPPTADQSSEKRPTAEVIRTILAANGAMLTKQGSLLLGWTIASRRATRLGPAFVAAHQVGLTVWLVFALILDGPAVSAQVLMSQSYARRDKREASSLISYMTKFAVIQGLVSMFILDGLDLAVPRIFTNDPVVRGYIHKLMPHLAVQQILVSLTLVMESLAVGGNQFRILAGGTMLTTVAAVWQISRQTSIHGIWSVGIVTLFAGRFLTACLATWRAFYTIDRRPTLEPKAMGEA